MKNKLPVVGKKYKFEQIDGTNIILEVAKITTIIEVSSNGKHFTSLGFEEFWSCGPEELPEDKAETKAETQGSELSLEVKEAMEGLRSLHFPACQLMTASIAIEELNKFRLTSLNLLNALDKQFNLPQENTNLGEEWGSFGAVLGNDKLESLENKESIITMKKSEFESLMAGTEKVDKVDTDIKKQTVDEFLFKTEKEKFIWKPISAPKPNELVPVGFVYQATLNKQFAYTLEPREKDVLDDKIEEFNKKTNAEPLKAEDIIDNKIEIDWEK